jgi:hypothetical protein
MLQKLNGYKTYIVCSVVLLYNLVQLWNGSIDANTAFQNSKDAILGCTIRHSIAKL